MIVAYAATRNLYDDLRPAIASLLTYNKPEKVYIVIEDDELPFNVPDVCEIVNVSGQTWITPGGPNWNTPFTPMVMIRICYEYYLPATVKKVLQLDVDTIVLEGLAPLFNIDLGDAWAAMVNEREGAYKPFGPDYFNCGVTLFDLEKMRREKITDQLVGLINTRKMRFTEQDAINTVGEGRIYELPTRYNECFATGRTEKPAIVHFAGSGKFEDPRRELIRVFRSPPLQKIFDG